jgi:hypothetical protein
MRFINQWPRAEAVWTGSIPHLFHHAQSEVEVIEANNQLYHSSKQCNRVKIFYFINTVLWNFFQMAFWILHKVWTLSEGFQNNLLLYTVSGGTRQCSWWSHYATSRKVASSISQWGHWIFFNWHPSSRPMALGSTQRLTEMSTMNLPGDKGQPTLKADSLTAICEPIV